MRGRQPGAAPMCEVEDGICPPGIPSCSVVAFGCAARIQKGPKVPLLPL
jgi:hypothetical protein